MSFSFKIPSSDESDFLSSKKRPSLEEGASQLPIDQEPIVREDSLDFRDVTGENSQDSYFYSVLKKIFRSAYKFFSYLSNYFTSCFSQNSFRDVTSNTTPTTNEEATSHADSIIERAAAAVINERREHQKIIGEYDLFYTQYSEFYQQQEEFLKNYLEYLQAAFKHTKARLQKFGYLKEKKAVKIGDNETSRYLLIHLVGEIAESFELLKEIPALSPLAQKTEDLLFKNKKEGDKIIRFSAKDLATIIQGQLDYFKMRHASSRLLKREVEELSADRLDLMVSFDPQEQRIAATEFVGRKIAPERLPKQEELLETKAKSEHARWSLLSYMATFRKELEECVRLLDEEVNKFEALIRAEAAERTKKDYEAYRRSGLRYKI